MLSHTAAPQPLRAVCAVIVTQLSYKARGRHRSSGAAAVTQIFPFGQLDIFDAVSKEERNQGCVDGLKPAGWQPAPLWPELLLSPSGELVQSAENRREAG